MWALSAVDHRRLGMAGAVAVAAGGWAAGRLPAHDPWGLWVARGPAVTTAATLLAYAGLAVLVAAWWGYGRTDPSARDVRGTLVRWAAPLLVVPPLHSADVYSYVAQGAMVLEGHDVYGEGPSVLDPAGRGGDAAASVGHHWTHTPAPYGPFFLVLARAAAWLTGGAIVPAVLLMRLVAVGSLVLVVWAVARLARDHGVGEGGALWLAALNPLLLVHVVGGIHNDGLMAGLTLAGAVLALRGRWVAGSALIGLAVLVKSPAAVALLFVGVVVGRAAAGSAARRVAKGLLGPGLVASAVAVGTTLLAGTGFGWLRTQSVAGTIHTALSLSSDVGLGVGLLLRSAVGADPQAVKSAVGTLGLAVAGVLILVLARRAAVGRTEPVHALGLGLVALVVLSPMVQPWYLLWGTVVVAATGWRGTAGRWLAVASAALVFVTHPTGATPWYGFVTAGVVAAGLAVAVRRERRAVSGGAVLPGPRRAADAPVEAAPEAV
ncbi:polyprenol phosphomannose-dependent alpha 1,6 mannosyltransferase MptB [uncultured Streptomyces sp.]|uniref:polyprenol phosphomannose-dependent alpha 1,6 mannosyltransferase MptB n=1 Tax=uncultured Streptomyces sp. TaxID=174707 RepID=UPI002631EE11|nr:polyprenol phosphomannose-dependent alpha 1,6 mannosyltransferase MptB [uncultured Streptomyces sp.]